MTAKKHCAGDLVIHKLTGERLMVIEVIKPVKVYYKCRAGDYNVINAEGCEIEAVEKKGKG